MLLRQRTNDRFGRETTHTDTYLFPIPRRPRGRCLGVQFPRARSLFIRGGISFLRVHLETCCSVANNLQVGNLRKLISSCNLKVGRPQNSSRVRLILKHYCFRLKLRRNKTHGWSGCGVDGRRSWLKRAVNVIRYR